MPGAPRGVPPQDKVRDSTLLLPLPGEYRVHAASKVCVRAQEGIKEQGHRALASAFKALRKVLQVLIQDGDPWSLGQLSLQQGMRVDGAWLHIGDVARQQVGQADTRRTIACRDRAGC